MSFFVCWSWNIQSLKLNQFAMRSLARSIQNDDYLNCSRNISFIIFNFVWFGFFVSRNRNRIVMNEWMFWCAQLYHIIKAELNAIIEIERESKWQLPGGRNSVCWQRRDEKLKVIPNISNKRPFSIHPVIQSIRCNVRTASLVTQNIVFVRWRTILHSYFPEGSPKAFNPVLRESLA